jgi:hypothetical protein
MGARARTWRSRGPNAAASTGAARLATSPTRADWSLCSETGGAIVAELTWRTGWAGGSVGDELDLDCLNVKGSGKYLYGPVAVGVDTSGGVSAGYSSPENHVGGQRQGRIAYKRCAKF